MPAETVPVSGRHRGTRRVSRVTVTVDDPMSRRFLKPVSTAGLAVGLVFMAGSLVPSMLPRPWYVEAAVAGLSAALGYGFGSASEGLWRRIRQRPRNDVSAFVSCVSLTLPVALVIWMLVVHLRWQDDVRVLMGMDPGAGPYLVAATLGALGVGFILVVAGWGTVAASRGFLGLVRRVMRGWLAVIVGLATALTLLILFADLVVASRLVPALEQAHHTSDRSFDPGVAPPDSPLLSGSPGSLIDWERMGRQGRLFVDEAPSTAELGDFAGAPAIGPIRIYVGLEVAETPERRAALALAEMERTGAFDREVIVLVAPTGSGWIDPYAVEAVELMYKGDTATIAVQYSYLASWMVMIRNQDLAADTSRALYRVVSQRLGEEPTSTRPKLLLYGESLGAFGWERTFSELAELKESADGVLLVGPPAVNPVWRALVAERDPGSPLWRPVYRGGESVRFGPDRESLLAPDADWATPRIVYLQHASDPITWLALDLIFQRPAWLDEPRGPDVSRHMPYVPVVTYLQMVVDLALGTGAPPGHGHKFGPAQAEAWSLILPPAGWTMEDTDAMLARLDP